MDEKQVDATQPVARRKRGRPVGTTKRPVETVAAVATQSPLDQIADWLASAAVFVRSLNHAVAPPPEVPVPVPVPVPLSPTVPFDDETPEIDRVLVEICETAFKIGMTLETLNGWIRQFKQKYPSIDALPPEKLATATIDDLSLLDARNTLGMLKAHLAGVAGTGT